MITAKNLQKAGFVAGDKNMFGEAWYREWTIVVSPHIYIIVTEDSDGSFQPELSIRRDFTTLNLTTVTELITLAKLLK